MPKICFLQTLKIDVPTSLGNMYFKLLENKTVYLKVIRRQVLEMNTSNSKCSRVLLSLSVLPNVSLKSPLLIKTKNAA